MATVAVTVIGHPTVLAVSKTIDLGGTPGPVAFTNNAMLAAITGLLKVAIYDPTASTQTGLVSLTTPVPILLAPTRASGPAVAIDGGGFSKLWFIDPASAAVTDSVSVTDVVGNGNAAMTTTGSQVFYMQAGDLVVLDGATHAQVARLSMGGGVTKLAIAPGDTLMYGLTNVGVIFEIDIKNLVVKRQIPANVSSTDFAIGRDGLCLLARRHQQPGAVVQRQYGYDRTDGWRFGIGNKHRAHSRRAADLAHAYHSSPGHRVYRERDDRLRRDRRDCRHHSEQPSDHATADLLQPERELCGRDQFRWLDRHHPLNCPPRKRRPLRLTERSPLSSARSSSSRRTTSARTSPG